MTTAAAALGRKGAPPPDDASGLRLAGRPCLLRGGRRTSYGTVTTMNPFDRSFRLSAEAGTSPKRYAAQTYPVL